MRSLVVDASVIVGALLRFQPEQNAARAVSLWMLAAAGEIPVIQPPHWLAEVCGVLARLSPRTAVNDPEELYALDLPIAATAEVYMRATELALELDHHLFDTLYHAVAMKSPDGLLVTADDRYYREASRLGAVVRLADFDLSLVQ